MVRISKKWIIFLVILVGLLMAWGFRWQTMNEVTNQGVKIVYLKDRWCGQIWTITYKGANVTESPVLNPEAINSVENSLSSVELDSANKAYNDYLSKPYGDYYTANQLYSNLKIAQQQKHDMAVNILNKAAWNKRTDLTHYWFYLFGISLLILFVSIFFECRNHSKS